MVWSYYEKSFKTLWFFFCNTMEDIARKSKILLYGTGNSKNISMSYKSERFKGEYKGSYEGVINNLKRRYDNKSQER